MKTIKFENITVRQAQLVSTLGKPAALRDKFTTNEIADWPNRDFQIIRDKLALLPSNILPPKAIIKTPKRKYQIIYEPSLYKAHEKKLIKDFANDDFLGSLNYIAACISRKVKSRFFPGWDPLESTCRHASLSIL